MYKVCFVDDETINHQLLENIVDWEKYGFMIAGTATDGLEALRLYEEVKPDLMLIDIKMPLMDGLECVRCIRKVDSNIQLVLVTAYGEFAYAQKAIQYGVQNYVLKPVSRLVINEMISKISMTLDQQNEKILDKQNEISKKSYLFYQMTTDLKSGIDIELNKKYDALINEDMLFLEIQFNDQLQDSNEEEIIAEFIELNNFDVLAMTLINHGRYFLLYRDNSKDLDILENMRNYFCNKNVFVDLFRIEKPISKKN